MNIMMHITPLLPRSLPVSCIYNGCRHYTYNMPHPSTSMFLERERDRDREGREGVNAIRKSSGLYDPHCSLVPANVFLSF
jgi:hypothetical protein